MTKEDEEQDLHNVYMFYLEQAHVSAQKALDVLYAPGAPKRIIWHRMLLGRAQSILISMYNWEKTREDRRKSR